MLLQVVTCYYMLLHAITLFQICIMTCLSHLLTRRQDTRMTDFFMLSYIASSPKIFLKAILRAVESIYFKLAV